MSSPDHLNDFERQLMQWQPATSGLDSDAMLFRAGLEAGRRNQPATLWPAFSVLLLGVCAGLAAWGWSERAEHRTLAQQIQQNNVKQDTIAETSVASASYIPSSHDYLQMRRQAEHDLDHWLAAMPQNNSAVPKPMTNPDIPQAGLLKRFLDQ